MQRLPPRHQCGDQLEGSDWMVWRDQPADDHTWAFFYQCKRRGDKVAVSQAGRGNVHIAVKRREGRP